MNVLCQFFCGVDNKGQVRVAGVAQRGRHTDADRIRTAEPGEIGGRLQATIFHQAGNRFGWYIHDIALAAVDRIYFSLDRVNTQTL